MDILRKIKQWFKDQKLAREEATGIYYSDYNESDHFSEQNELVTKLLLEYAKNN